MDINAVARMARATMDAHGLHNWEFAFDRAVRRAGSCNYTKRQITLSRALMANWEESEVRNTLLHEVAHAMAGPYAGHGPTWRRIARSIGCTGDRCWTPSEAAPTVPGAWTATCPNGHTRERHRKPTVPVSCGACSRSFDPSNLLRWERRASR